MSNTGYDRSLGTSKKEQGIITPPQPKHHHCGCWYLGKDLTSMCQIHQDSFRNLMNNLQQLKKMQEEQSKEEAKKQAKQVSKAMKPKAEPVTA